MARLKNNINRKILFTVICFMIILFILPFFAHFSNAEYILKTVKSKEDEISSTDAESIIVGSGHVTTYGIIFNKIPLFNINFFDLDEEKFAQYTATGEELLCSCCKDENGHKIDGKDISSCVAVRGEGENREAYCVDGCDCRGCADCRAYATAILEEGKPVIILLKEQIATWYYILRMLSLAAMVVVLIVVGFKMVFSTISQDKALYKQMLIDWVVGMILILTMHYIMIFAVTITETFVEVIEKVNYSVNEDEIKLIAEEFKYDSTADIEKYIYAEAVSREYSFSLIEGMLGIILHVAMLGLAFKYSLIYMRRFFNLAILTLLAPPIGIAYALQKVFTGKSQTIGLWLKEYILTLFIQVIHAIIYAMFVTPALLYSMTNISGFLLAFVMLNFMDKAEKLFKAIFEANGKFGNDVTGFGDAGRLMKTAQESAKVLTSSPGMIMAGKMLLNTPYTKALRFAGRTVVSGAKEGGYFISSAINRGLHGGKAVDRSDANPASNSTIGMPLGEGNAAKKQDRYTTKGVKRKKGKGKGTVKVSGASNGGKTEVTGAKGTAKKGSEGGAVTIKGPAKGKSSGNRPQLKNTSRRELLNKGRSKLIGNLSAAQQKALVNPTAENIQEVMQAKKDIMDFDNIANPNSYLRRAIEGYGGTYRSRFGRRADGRHKFIRGSYGGSYNSKHRIASYGLFGGRMADYYGKLKYNPITNKMERDKSNTLMNSTGFGAALNLTDAEKKFRKDQLLRLGKSAAGIMALVGAPWMIGYSGFNAKFGMAVLAFGGTQTHKAMNYYGISPFSRKYTFNRFSPNALVKIKETGLELASKEYGYYYSNGQYTHKFYKTDRGLRPVANGTVGKDEHVFVSKSGVILRIPKEFTVTRNGNLHSKLDYKSFIKLNKEKADTINLENKDDADNIEFEESIIDNVFLDVMDRTKRTKKSSTDTTIMTNSTILEIPELGNQEIDTRNILGYLKAQRLYESNSASKVNAKPPVLPEGWSVDTKTSSIILPPKEDDPDVQRRLVVDEKTGTIAYQEYKVTGVLSPEEERKFAALDALMQKNGRIQNAGQQKEYANLKRKKEKSENKVEVLSKEHVFVKPENVDEPITLDVLLNNNGSEASAGQTMSMSLGSLQTQAELSQSDLDAIDALLQLDQDPDFAALLSDEYRDGVQGQDLSRYEYEKAKMREKAFKEKQKEYQKDADKYINEAATQEVKKSLDDILESTFAALAEVKEDDLREEYTEKVSDIKEIEPIEVKKIVNGKPSEEPEVVVIERADIERAMMDTIQSTIDEELSKNPNATMTEILDKIDYKMDGEFQKRFTENIGKRASIYIEPESRNKLLEAVKVSGGSITEPGKLREEVEKRVVTKDTMKKTIAESKRQDLVDIINQNLKDFDDKSSVSLGQQVTEATRGAVDQVMSTIKTSSETKKAATEKAKTATLTALFASMAYQEETSKKGVDTPFKTELVKNGKKKAYNKMKFESVDEIARQIRSGKPNNPGTNKP